MEATEGKVLPRLETFSPNIYTKTESKSYFSVNSKSRHKYSFKILHSFHLFNKKLFCI